MIYVLIMGEREQDLRIRSNRLVKIPRETVEEWYGLSRRDNEALLADLGNAVAIIPFGSDLDLLQAFYRRSRLRKVANRSLLLGKQHTEATEPCVMSIFQKLKLRPLYNTMVLSPNLAKRLGWMRDGAPHYAHYRQIGALAVMVQADSETHIDIVAPPDLECGYDWLQDTPKSRAAMEHAYKEWIDNLRGYSPRQQARQIESINDTLLGRAVSEFVKVEVQQPLKEDSLSS